MFPVFILLHESVLAIYLVLLFHFVQGFGPADHTISVGVLKRKFPSLEITSSKEGY